MFQLDPLWVSVAVIEASLPVAATVFVVAQQYETYVDRTSAIVLVSTAISMITVSVVLALLG